MRPLYGITSVLIFTACFLSGCATTNGTDIRQNELAVSRHHDHYEQFWELLKQADSVWNTISDTTDQIAVRVHLMPYVEHIMDIAEEILP